MPQTLPDPNSTPRAVVAITAVENVRAVPLWQLADTAERMLHRIIPLADAAKRRSQRSTRRCDRGPG